MEKGGLSLAQVKQSLLSLPCFDGVTIESITPFFNGLSHHVFNVRCLDDKLGSQYNCVAKWLEGHQTGDKEASVTTYLAKHQLTPTVMFCNSQWLITSYLAGSTLMNANLSIQQKLELSTELLNQLYCIGEDDQLLGVNLFDPLPYVDTLIQASTFSSSIKTSLLDLVKAHSVDMSALKKVIIHGDANFCNFIFKTGEDSLQMIDFEASSFSTREYDIAMLLAVNHIPMKTIHLVKKTHNIFSEISQISVMRYLVISCLINVLWYFEQFYKTGSLIYRTNALKTLHYLDKETNGKYLVIKEMR